MYFLLGFLVATSSMTYIAMNRSKAQEEARAIKYAHYKKSMNENEAYWDALYERYTAFDTLVSAMSPKPVPRKLRGYWLMNSHIDGYLLHIDDDSVQTDYKMNRGDNCYKKEYSSDLLFYGDVHYISKSRGREQRYHYSFENHDSLNIEEILKNGNLGVATFRRVYFSNSDESKFCRLTTWTR